VNAKAIFVGGTSSGAGKSWVATAICRVLRQRGLRVAPFKAQNMSNNSFPCPSGGEIGRAQMVQAEACGLAPEPAMNPILLKPTGDRRSQIVLHGKVWGSADARDYYTLHEQLRREAHRAYDGLRARFDYIVLEGAGSIAEMNLKPRDIVNMSMAEYADARALLVSDIDRGGVFASICGTMDLLPAQERARIRAFVVNRFRGDPTLFDDGVRFIEQRANVPCLGVFPMNRDIQIHEEDGVYEEPATDEQARIAVIRLPRVSNLTDFRHLPCRWIMRPTEAPLDWIILPGTKNTLADLDWLRAQGLDEWILRKQREGVRILGVCGGFQMLGRIIDDPQGVEGPVGMRDGLGLLPVVTTLAQEKTVRTVSATTPAGVAFGAYEIHMGETVVDLTGRPFATLADGTHEGLCVDNVFGTYLHGALEDARVVAEIFGIAVTASSTQVEYDKLADWFRASAKMKLFEEQFL
jgi:adenosylcobyric acid synthase